MKASAKGQGYSFEGTSHFLMGRLRQGVPGVRLTGVVARPRSRAASRMASLPETWRQEGDGHPNRQQQPLPNPGGLLISFPCSRYSSLDC